MTTYPLIHALCIIYRTNNSTPSIDAWVLLEEDVKALERACKADTSTDASFREWWNGHYTDDSYTLLHILRNCTYEDIEDARQLHKALDA